MFKRTNTNTLYVYQYHNYVEHLKDVLELSLTRSGNIPIQISRLESTTLSHLNLIFQGPQNTRKTNPSRFPKWWIFTIEKITLLRVIPTMTFIHFLTGKSSGILSDISSDILFDILSGISSGI